MPSNSDKNEKDAQPGVGNQDTQIAEAAGLSEGDVKGLRLDAGLDQLAGHEGNVLAWEASQEGQAWLAGEDERQKQVEAENEAVEASLKETEKPVEEYKKAVEAGRKQAKKAASAAKKSS